MGKKRSSKITLSYPKLEGLISRSNYTIHKLYTEKDHVTFMLCKSPRFQKSFVVYIPPRFKLVPPKRKSSGTIEYIDITKTPSSEISLSQRQLSYLSDITSKEANSIISISNKTLVSHTPKLTEHYIIAGEEDEDEVDNEDSDEVMSLEKNTKRLEKTINKLSKTKSNTAKKDKNKKESKPEKKKGLTLKEDISDKKDESESAVESATESVEEKEENSADSDEEDEEEEASNLGEEDEDHENDNPEESTKVALVFEEGDSDGLEEALSSEEEEEEDEEDSSVDSTGETGDNSFPQDMLERDVVIGVIYVLIDVSSFLKSISSFEESLLVQYSQIDENEFELKKGRLSRIKEAFDIVYEAANESLSSKHEEEKKIKSKIVRSTILLLQVQSLKDKIKENPSKYSDVNSEVQETLEQTIKTISNMNLEIMELRDDIDEMLTNFAAVVSDLEGVVKL